MQDELDRKFNEATRDMKSNSPEWLAVRFKYDMMRAGAAKENNYRIAIINSIIKSNSQIKKLQVSTLTHLKTERLLAIGAAMAVLYDELEKDNLINLMNNVSASK